MTAFAGTVFVGVHIFMFWKWCTQAAATTHYYDIRKACIIISLHVVFIRSVPVYLERVSILYTNHIVSTLIELRSAPGGAAASAAAYISSRNRFPSMTAEYKGMKQSACPRSTLNTIFCTLFLSLRSVAQQTQQCAATLTAQQEPGRARRRRTEQNPISYCLGFSMVNWSLPK